MHPKYNFKIVKHGEEAYWQTVALRDDVLRKPLHLNFTKEELLLENDSLHLVCEVDGKIVACLILKKIDEKTVKMRQVAVATALQGTGIGKKLIQYAEKVAQENGFQRIELHVRTSAVPFYLKLVGYRTIGDEFLEVGLPHLAMEKHLSTSTANL